LKHTTIDCFYTNNAPLRFEEAVALEPQHVGVFGLGRGPLHPFRLVFAKIPAKLGVVGFEGRVGRRFFRLFDFGLFGQSRGVVFHRVLPPKGGISDWLGGGLSHRLCACARVRKLHA